MKIVDQATVRKKGRGLVNSKEPFATTFRALRGRLLYDPKRISKAVYADSQAAVTTNLVDVFTIVSTLVATSILKGHAIPTALLLSS